MIEIGNIIPCAIEVVETARRAVVVAGGGEVYKGDRHVRCHVRHAVSHPDEGCATEPQTPYIQRMAEASRLLVSIDCGRKHKIVWGAA